MQVSTKQVAAHLDTAVQRITTQVEQDPLPLVLARMAFRDAQVMSRVAVSTGNNYAWEMAMGRLWDAYCQAGSCTD